MKKSTMRVLSLVMAIVMIVGTLAVVPFSAISYEVGPIEHVHTKGEIVRTVAPTCNLYGYTVYVCAECGDEYIDDVTQKLGHNYQYVGEVAGDCKTGTVGRNAGWVCTICGDVLEGCEEIPAEHGEAYRLIDGYYYTDEDGKVIFDEDGEVANKADCIKGVVYQRYCPKCGEIIDENVNVIVEGEEQHDLVLTLIPEEGIEINGETYYPVTCDRDGYVLVDCQATAYYFHNFEDCDFDAIPVYVEALGHKFGDWATTAGENCTDYGTKSRTCRVCGYVETEEDALLGHLESDTVERVEPKCEETGVYAYTYCKRCGIILTITKEEEPEDVSAQNLPRYIDDKEETLNPELIIPALGHNWEEKWSEEGVQIGEGDDAVISHHYNECTRCHKKVPLEEPEKPEAPSDHMWVSNGFVFSIQGGAQYSSTDFDGTGEEFMAFYAQYMDISNLYELYSCEWPTCNDTRLVERIHKVGHQYGSYTFHFKGSVIGKDKVVYEVNADFSFNAGRVEKIYACGEDTVVKKYCALCLARDEAAEPEVTKIDGIEKHNYNEVWFCQNQACANNGVALTVNNNTDIEEYYYCTNCTHEHAVGYCTNYVGTETTVDGYYLIVEGDDELPEKDPDAAVKIYVNLFAEYKDLDYSELNDSEAEDYSRIVYVAGQPEGLAQCKDHADLAAGEHGEPKAVEAKKATCAAPGTKAYTYCEVCNTILTIGEGEEAEDDGVDQLYVGGTLNQKLIVEVLDLGVLESHYAGERIYVDATAATCVSTGNKAYTYCSLCDTILAIGEKEVENEDNDDNGDAQPGGDTGDAQPGDDNGDEQEEELAGEIVVEKKYKRIVNNALNAELVTDVLDRKVVENHGKSIEVAAVAPTCTEAGNKAFTYCELCETIITIGEGEEAETVAEKEYSRLVDDALNPVVVIAKLDHNLSDWIIDSAPTCTEVGTKHKECQREGCNYVLDGKDQALGHDLVTAEGETADCFTDGKNPLVKCQREGCGKIFTVAEAKELEVDIDLEGLADEFVLDGKIIPKFDHKYDGGESAIANQPLYAGDKLAEEQAFYKVYVDDEAFERKSFALGLRATKIVRDKDEEGRYIGYYVDWVEPICAKASYVIGDYCVLCAIAAENDDYFSEEANYTGYRLAEYADHAFITYEGTGENGPIPEPIEEACGGKVYYEYSFRYCPDCGIVRLDEFDLDRAKDHAPEYKAVENEEEEPEVQTYIVVLDEERGYIEINADNADDYPVCTNMRYEAKKCAYCDEFYDAEPITTLGHYYINEDGEKVAINFCTGEEYNYEFDLPVGEYCEACGKRVPGYAVEEIAEGPFKGLYKEHYYTKEGFEIDQDDEEMDEYLTSDHDWAYTLDCENAIIIECAKCGLKFANIDGSLIKGILEDFAESAEEAADEAREAADAAKTAAEEAATALENANNALENYWSTPGANLWGYWAAFYAAQDAQAAKEAADAEVEPAEEAAQMAEFFAGMLRDAADGQRRYHEYLYREGGFGAFDIDNYDEFAFDYVVYPTASEAGYGRLTCIKCGERLYVELPVLDFEISASYDDSDIFGDKDIVVGHEVTVTVNITACNYAFDELRFYVDKYEDLFELVDVELLYEFDPLDDVVVTLSKTREYFTVRARGAGIFNDAVTISGDNVPFVKLTFRTGDVTDAEEVTTVFAGIWSEDFEAYSDFGTLNIYNPNYTETAVAVLKHIFDGETSTKYDFNGDGFVDFDDYVALVEYQDSNKTVKDFIDLTAYDLEAMLDTLDYAVFGKKQWVRISDVVTIFTGEADAVAFAKAVIRTEFARTDYEATIIEGQISIAQFAQNIIDEMVNA